jgi:hypothetical protein
MRSFIVALMFVATSARAQQPAPVTDQPLGVSEDAPRATTVARDGELLPQTFSPTIGHKQVIGLFLGGYDSAKLQGPEFSALVEGQLFHRVAIRVGVDYQDAIHSVYPSVGVRVGILQQERFKVDLGLIAQYKKLGFSEASGEFEFGVLVGHRWGKLGAQLNAIYGQGLDEGERDAEVRASVLYFIRPRLNAGLDVRARVDLGQEDEARTEAKLEADFDFLGGAIAQLTVVEHIVLMAEVGPHVVVISEKPQAGAVALFGVGATY